MFIFFFRIFGKGYCGSSCFFFYFFYYCNSFLFYGGFFLSCSCCVVDCGYDGVVFFYFDVWLCVEFFVVYWGICCVVYGLEG